MTDILEATILGSGSSSGVPRLGGPDGAGDWGACDPANPKNRRKRCSLLVRRKSAAGETTVLVDTSPDLREQLLDAHCAKLDAVLITHDHADQLHGIDDLRAVAYLMRKRIDVYSDAETIDRILQRFGYCFETPENSGYPPILTASNAARTVPADADRRRGRKHSDCDLRTDAWPHPFARLSLWSYRLFKRRQSLDRMKLSQHLKAWRSGSWMRFRYTPHPTHANVETALSWIARVKPRRAILTNLHIDLDYETLKRELPPGVEPAYDGMVVRTEI